MLHRRFAPLLTCSLLSVLSLAPTVNAADSDLRLSSIGYVPGAQKRATVLGVTSGPFVVRRVSDGVEAFSGELTAAGSAGVADFSALDAAGTYLLEVPGVGASPQFPIASTAYVEPYRAVMLGFYAWRSGIDVAFTYGGQSYAHDAGHLQDGYLDFVGQPGVLKDGTGGWYDAGDYGKYTVNSAITMGLLLQAWEDFRPHLEPIALDIPEAGGALPDYLAELRFQLDWMLKMQFADGSVSHKLTPIDFPGFIPPAADTEPRYFSPWGSAATAGFAATLAKAERVYREFDAAYAETLAAAAASAYAFLTANPGNHPADMSAFAQAQYQTTDGDDRIWAAAELWESTGDASALADFEARVSQPSTLVQTNWDWNNQSNLGVFTYLRSERAGKDEALVARLEAALIAVADIHVANASGAYGRGITEVYWGSNGTVARICATLQVALELTGDARYAGACSDQVAHLFGRNEYGRSQVTGVGIAPPLYPHDRRSGSDAIVAPYPGYLVGGASSPGNWQDLEESYETNEIAINWQGALVYALARFLSPTEGAGGEGGAGGAASETGGAASETGGAASETGGAAPGGATASGGATGGTSAGVGGSHDDPTATDADGGCGCRAARQPAYPGAALALLGAAALLRRRRAATARAASPWRGRQRSAKRVG